MLVATFLARLDLDQISLVLVERHLGETIRYGLISNEPNVLSQQVFNLFDLLVSTIEN